MECNKTEQVQKEHEIKYERCHQDFMMMIMMMVTGVMSPVSSISPPSSSSHLVMPTKVAPQAEEDALEEEIAKEMLLHDTVMYMQTPDSPD
eukprot:5620096-Ditylum_brightwellii.AAC.1